jgi:hypothetical protein
VAEQVRRSIAPDTPDFVSVRVEGATLRIHLEARSATSARETLEDLLACVQVAERTLGVRVTATV